MGRLTNITVIKKHKTEHHDIMWNFKGLAMMYLAVVFSVFSITFSQPIIEDPELSKSFLMHPIGFQSEKSQEDPAQNIVSNNNNNNEAKNLLSSDSTVTKKTKLNLIKILNSHDENNFSSLDETQSYDSREEVRGVLISDNVNVGNFISSISEDSGYSDGDASYHVSSSSSELNEDSQGSYYYGDNNSEYSENSSSNYDTVDGAYDGYDVAGSELSTAPFFVNPVFYTNDITIQLESNDIQSQLGFDISEDKKDDSSHFLMDAANFDTVDPEKKTRDPCAHVCSNRINFNDKMFIKPLCSSTGKFYDSQSNPSLACDRCRNNVEIDRELKFTACESGRVCVEGQSSWRCPWW